MALGVEKVDAAWGRCGWPIERRTDCIRWGLACGSIQVRPLVPSRTKDDDTAGFYSVIWLEFPTPEENGKFSGCGI